jgi:hypothetical protein
MGPQVYFNSLVRIEGQVTERSCLWLTRCPEACQIWRHPRLASAGGDGDVEAFVCQWSIA